MSRVQQQQKITSHTKKWESMVYSKSTEYFSEKDQMTDIQDKDFKITAQRTKGRQRKSRKQCVHKMKIAIKR